MCRLVFAWLGLGLLLASTAGLLFLTRAVWLEALGGAWRRVSSGSGRYARQGEDADDVGLISIESGPRHGKGYSSPSGLSPVSGKGDLPDEELGDPFDAGEDAAASYTGIGDRLQQQQRRHEGVNGGSTGAGEGPAVVRSGGSAEVQRHAEGL